MSKKGCPSVFSIAGSSVGPVWCKQPVAEGGTGSLPIFPLPCSIPPIYSAGLPVASIKPYLAPCWHWGPERLSSHWPSLSRALGLPSSKPFWDKAANPCAFRHIGSTCHSHPSSRGEPHVAMGGRMMTSTCF